LKILSGSSHLSFTLMFLGTLGSRCIMSCCVFSDVLVRPPRCVHLSPFEDLLSQREGGILLPFMHVMLIQTSICSSLNSYYAAVSRLFIATLLSFRCMTPLAEFSLRYSFLFVICRLRPNPTSYYVHAVMLFSRSYMQWRCRIVTVNNCWLGSGSRLCAVCTLTSFPRSCFCFSR